MKSSSIEESLLSKCKTTNKIIESSLLIDTQWVDMAIEIGTVLGNFGLRKSELKNCTLYIKQINNEFKALEWREFAAIVNQQPLSPIERFRLSYFHTGVADGDAATFEEVLNPRNWSGDAIIEASFGALLTRFAQFLIALYGSDRLAAYAILHFHTHNFELLEWLTAKPELLSLYQAAAGVHLTLTREVDNFTSILQAVVDAYEPQRKVRIAAEGPLDKTYYMNLFSELGIERIVVESVQPRNSPVDLLVSFLDYGALMSGIAVVLASRTKFELSKIQHLTIAPSTQSKTVHRGEDARQLISFQTGFLPDRPSEFQINVRTLLPRALLLDLHLTFSVAVFKKVRSILISLLQPVGPSKSG